MKTVLDYAYRILEDLDYFAILALVFLATGLAVGSICLMFFRKEKVSGRLSKLLSTEKQIPGARQKLIQEEGHGLVAKMANPLHNIVAPSQEAAKRKIRLKLLQAGFRSKQAYRNYLALKVVCTGLLPLIFLAQNLFFTMSPQTVMIFILLAGIGFFLPDLALSSLVQKRRQGILQAIPNALDLMVVCVEAGLGLDLTFKRVGDEIRPLSEDLSDEFYLANLEVQAGRPREESLRNMALRTGVSEVQNLMTILIQTNRLGTSLGKALRIHADAMRTKKRQVAEEKAAKAGVKLVFPLIFFIFPAMFVVLIGPAAIRIAKQLLPALGGP